MQTDVIVVGEIDDYLKFVEAQRELVVRLSIYNETQKLQLERLKQIQRCAENIARIKAVKKYNIKGTDRQTINDAIKKYARHIQ